MLPVILCRGFSGKIPASKFELLMYLKAFRALAEPGEAVGLLAAQVSHLIRLKVMSPLIKPCFTGPFGEKKTSRITVVSRLRNEVVWLHHKVDSLQRTFLY